MVSEDARALSPTERRVNHSPVRGGMIATGPMTKKVLPTVCRASLKRVTGPLVLLHHRRSVA